VVYTGNLETVEIEEGRAKDKVPHM